MDLLLCEVSLLYSFPREYLLCAVFFLSSVLHFYLFFFIFLYLIVFIWSWSFDFLFHLFDLLQFNICVSCSVFWGLWLKSQTQKTILLYGVCFVHMDIIVTGTVSLQTLVTTVKAHWIWYSTSVKANKMTGGNCVHILLAMKWVNKLWYICSLLLIQFSVWMEN